MGKTDKLAALKAAREGGSGLSRLKAYKTENSDIYDTLTESEYRQVVGNRLARDDFIEDDGVDSGYVDNGMDVEFEGDGVNRRKRNGRYAGSSDEESDGMGGYSDDENHPRSKKNASGAKTSKKPKAKPVPQAAPSAYRPQVSAVQEADFMASLLSTVGGDTNASGPVSVSAIPHDYDPEEVDDDDDLPSARRKRKSSPDYEVPTSDSFFDPPTRDDSGPWELRDQKSKKPRTSVKFQQDQEDDDDHSVEPEHLVKLEPMEDGERSDEEAIGFVGRSSVKKAPTSVRDRLLGNQRPAYQSSSTFASTSESKPRVNASAVSAKAVASAEVARVKAESLAAEIQPPTQPAPAKASWTDMEARLNVGVAEEEPLGSPFTESAAKVKSYVPLIRLDAFEQGKSRVDEYGEEVQTLKMYWIDYWEGEKGAVHLLGKAFDRNTSRFVSCCVTVTGIERNLFVLPRARKLEDGYETDIEVSMIDVHQELEALRRKHGIEGRFGMKPVNRKYAFEVADVPKGESQWFKVVYGMDHVNGQTFSHVFGTNTSAFELLVIKRKIMGPCWLEIKDCVQVTTKPVSWCRLECRVSDPKNVMPLPEADAGEMPPLTVMSLTPRTIVNHKQNSQELLALTASVWENYNIEDLTPVEKLMHTPYTFVRPLGGKFPPGFEAKARTQRHVTVLRDERSMLNSFLSLVQRTDPDVIVGHDFFGVTVEVLLQRLKLNNVDHWSRIGRIRRTQLVVGKRATKNTRYFSGRLVADLSGDGSKGMIDSVSWSLSEMFNTQLGIAREEIDPDDTTGYFDPYAVNADRLFYFLRHLQMDAFGQMAISAKVQLLPLTKQLTNLAGNSWNRTLTGARAERNEYILLHEFHRLKYICPDKSWGKAPSRAAKQTKSEEGEEEGGSTNKKTTYTGGLVFSPKKGLWETHILVMDFNSLYPSIIQEYNIDFTTVERDDTIEVIEEAIPEIPSPDVPQGVLPRLIATLVGRRRQVKNLMKDKSAGQGKLLQWDIKQKALKLTANSMYGCLGFSGSRFYARPLAALTTFKGREILTRTKELAESMGLDVVYGDTDSVFVNSNQVEYEQAVKIANEFKRAVNDQYKLLELDLDYIFSRVLLLQKKKYAALKVSEDGKTTKMEIKGLDMVRREFCKLSKDASRRILDCIMSGRPAEEVVEEIHDYLTLIGNDVREKRVDLDDLVIFKRLGKDPEEYTDKNSQPHVQVALRMKAKGIAAKGGDVIPYVFCLPADGKSARTGQADNAHHPDDLRRAGSTLQIDTEYYLGTQILPAIQRLCEDIEGTDKARLAECLGLDPRRYHQSTSITTERDDFRTLESQISDAERFRRCDPLSLKCRACKSETVFSGLLEDVHGARMIQPTGMVCSCLEPIKTGSIIFQLDAAIRQHISRYYSGQLVCTECGERNRSMSVYGRRCVSKLGCRGEMQMEYSDSMLYNQLLYFFSLFDTGKAVAKSKGTGNAEEIQVLALHNSSLFEEATHTINAYLDKCGRRYVDLGGLFSFMDKLRVT